MTWSYNLALTATADKVRFLIGDTDPTRQLMQDEEISFLVTGNGSVREVAAQACEALATRFAAQGDLAVGDLRISALVQAKYYQTRANQLRRQADLTPIRIQVTEEAVRADSVLERPWKKL